MAAAPGNQAPSAEGEQAALQPVLEVLQGLDAKSLTARLDTKLHEAQAVDAQAGIVILPLDELTPVEAEGQTYHFYGARVMPAGPDNPNYVNPHVHREGQEPYFFLSGHGGEMNKGLIADGRVNWRPPRTVTPGEIEVIRPGEVHSFRNMATDTPFDFAFACPPNHLVDRDPQHPEGDREFTRVLGLTDPLPFQYPQ